VSRRVEHCQKVLVSRGGFADRERSRSRLPNSLRGLGWQEKPSTLSRLARDWRER
jgi:hypothetical protein